MTGGIRRDGDWARKPLGARHAGMGPELARRSMLLSAAGVRMPVVTYDETRDEIVYPYIAGTSGAERLRTWLARSGGNWELVIGRACADLLRPLIRLHVANAQDLALPPFDPWRRIRPRIEALAREMAEAPEDTGRAEAMQTFETLERTFGKTVGRRDAAEWVPVHGDFHVGQILFEPAGGEAWLLDADDFALGPPECDLGNFVAHLATSDHVNGAAPLAAFETLADLVIQSYGTLTEGVIERSEVYAYGAVALLRRALKRRERGGDQTAQIRAMLATAQTVAHRFGPER